MWPAFLKAWLSVGQHVFRTKKDTTAMELAVKTVEESKKAKKLFKEKSPAKASDLHALFSPLVTAALEDAQLAAGDRKKVMDVTNKMKSSFVSAVWNRAITSSNNDGSMPMAKVDYGDLLLEVA